MVVSGDWLAIRVCDELLATHGHRAAVVWMQVALMARDLNLAIRIVMRRFSRTLGVELERI